MPNKRAKFREACIERDNNNCLIPWCDNRPDEVHHIIERSEWDDGGYIQQNGASVCNNHHQYAESNDIPPQAFWWWLRQNEPMTPEGMGTQVDKWGEPLDSPPHKDLRERIKYQSTRHMLPLYWAEEGGIASERMTHDDTEMQQLDDFVGIPLVITEKTDGSNCMLVSDVENPVRARNGSRPEETMKPLYREGGLYWEQEVNQKLPNRLQVFGEWLWSKHSIHYGCDCQEECDDVGPNLTEIVDVDDERAYFQIFGAYDKVHDIWLSWPETKQVASELGFPTTPVIYEEDDDNSTYQSTYEARRDLIQRAHKVVNRGGEGIVVRTKFPFHYGQFCQRLGKYVRPNHVDSDAKHWSKRQKIKNKL
jgi:hypothetical protein